MLASTHKNFFILSLVFLEFVKIRSIFEISLSYIFLNTKQKSLKIGLSKNGTFFKYISCKSYKYLGGV